jgi:hypothetical protein
MKENLVRIALLLLFPLFLLAACDRSIDERLAAKAAAEKSLGISPTTFATNFDRAIRDVLEDRNDDDVDRLAPLYQIDASQLEKHILQAKVGPAQTSILGSLAKNGDLKSVGVMLTSPGEGARAEFLLCAEAASRLLITGGDEKKLPDILNRLLTNALNNPGERMTEIVGDKLLSVEILKQGVMLQIEHAQ